MPELLHLGQLGDQVKQRLVLFYKVVFNQTRLLWLFQRNITAVFLRPSIKAPGAKQLCSPFLQPSTIASYFKNQNDYRHVLCKVYLAFTLV